MNNLNGKLYDCINNLFTLSFHVSNIPRALEYSLAFYIINAIPAPIPYLATAPLTRRLRENIANTIRSLGIYEHRKPDVLRKFAEERHVFAFHRRTVTPHNRDIAFLINQEGVLSDFTRQLRIIPQNEAIFEIAAGRLMSLVPWSIHKHIRQRTVNLVRFNQTFHLEEIRKALKKQNANLPHTHGSLFVMAPNANAGCSNLRSLFTSRVVTHFKVRFGQREFKIRIDPTITALYHTGFNNNDVISPASMPQCFELFDIDTLPTLIDQIDEKLLLKVAFHLTYGYDLASRLRSSPFGSRIFLLENPTPVDVNRLESDNRVDEIIEFEHAGL